MKYVLPLLALALVLIISTCKKTTGFTGPKVYSVRDLRQGTLSIYTYNTDGTIDTVTSNSGSDTGFRYTGDTVYMGSSLTGNITGGFYYVKNALGLADTAFGAYQTQNFSMKYTYDGNGMPTEERIYVSHQLRTIITYQNAGKNVSIKTTQNVANGTSTNDFFVYFPSNTNSIGNQDEGKYHLGTSPANPIQKDVNINNLGDTVYTLYYRYTYDGSGRIDTLVSRKSIPGAVSSSIVDSMVFSYY